MIGVCFLLVMVIAICVFWPDPLPGEPVLTTDTLWITQDGTKLCGDCLYDEYSADPFDHNPAKFLDAQLFEGRCDFCTAVLTGADSSGTLAA